MTLAADNSVSSYDDIHKRSVFCRVPRETFLELLKQGTVQSCRKGRIQPSPDVKGLWLVINGAVHVLGADGSVIQKCQPGQVIELGTFLSDRKTWAHQWLASEDSEIVEIRAENVFKILKQDPIYFEFLQKVSQSIVLSRLKRDFEFLGIQDDVIFLFISKLKKTAVAEIFQKWQQSLFLVLVPVFTGVDPLDFNELTPLFSRELTPSISLS